MPAESAPVRRVTSTDVARASGVSRTTVSYVLNNTAGVSISAETRQLVLETAARLGYAPSAAARMLRSGRSEVVLVLLPRWVSSAVTEAFLGTFERALSAGGLTMLVYYGAVQGQLSRVWRAVTPRSIVSAMPFTDAELRELSQAGIQALTADEAVAGRPGVGSALQEQIGRMQARYLAEAGHVRIAYASTADEALNEFAGPRLDGVRQEFAARGLDAPVVAALDLEVASARPIVAEWYRRAVTAVAAYNDEVALAVLGAARREGLEVPGDLAVIGADDMPAARLVVPALTTVAQAVEPAARYLAARIVGPPESSGGHPKRVDHVLDVVVRDSV